MERQEQTARDGQEARLLALLHRVTHVLYHRMTGEQGKGRMLTILLRRGPMAQRELQDHADVRSASLSELLGKIEANGDIIRERDPADGRSIRLRLTEQGRREAETLEAERARFARDLFAPLDMAEQAELERLLGKLFAAWQAAAPEERSRWERHQEHRERHQERRQERRDRRPGGGPEDQ